MENSYVISWKSQDGSRVGRGKKLFTAEEAEQLAEELNQEFPQFIHEPLNLTASVPDTLAVPANIVTPDFSTPEIPQPEFVEAAANG